MTTNIKLSWLEKHSEKRIKRAIWKYYKKIKRLNGILQNVYDFNIAMSPVTKNMILEKINFYRSQIYKMRDYINWKFHNSNYDGQLRYDYYSERAIKEPFYYVLFSEKRKSEMIKG